MASKTVDEQFDHMLAAAWVACIMPPSSSAVRYDHAGGCWPDMAAASSACSANMHYKPTIWGVLIALLFAVM
jgi:hypothetical protein